MRQELAIKQTFFRADDFLPHKWRKRHGEIIAHTVDGRSPAPPNM